MIKFNEDKVILFLFRLVVIVCLISVFLNKASFAQDKILAIVNNEIITQKDLDDFMHFMQMQLSEKYKEDEIQDKIDSLKKDLLERLIEDRLILQEAKKEKIKIDKIRIDARIEQMRRRYTSDSQFQEALVLQGLTQADIEKKVTEQMLIFAIVDGKIRNKIVIKPQEVTNFYEGHQKDFAKPEERQVQSLSIRDPDLANKVSNALKSEGANFEKIAQDFSLTINQLGLIKKGQYKEEIEKVIFNLGLNRSSDLIKMNDVYYIFNVKQISPEKQSSLSEVSEDIHNLLFEKKMQEELVFWLDELKKNSYIAIKKD
jgi:parvulin-like peptidyl-prolyl isomerase